MLWYNGPTLFECFRKLLPDSNLIKFRPLRLPIQDVFKIGGLGIVLVGQIESGSLHQDASDLVLEPSGTRCELKAMEMFHEPITAAFPGDNIGILIKGVIYTEIKRGEVIGNVSWCPPKKLS